jgi:hypothetical protein
MKSSRSLVIFTLCFALPCLAQDSELEKLAADIAIQQRRIPAAERSPGIQMIESRLDRELLSRFRKLNVGQQAELMQRVLQRLSEPGIMKLVDGALLAEDFDAAFIDLHAWQIMTQDDSIQVSTTDGVLAVRGKVSGGITLGPGFAGAVSRTFEERDVELIARVSMAVAPPTVGAGDFLAFVHLCGTQPDWFTHVEFGRRSTGQVGWAVARRHLEAQAHITPVDGPLGIAKWNTVKIRHDSAGERTNVWITNEAGTRQVLKDEPCLMTTTKVELKTLVTIPGAEVDVVFDDCRLYRTPESAPLRLLVLDIPGEGVPQEGVRVVVRVADSLASPVAAVTNAEGRVQLALPSDVDYPARIRVEAWVAGKKVFQQSTPDVVGVRGVYPGDTWLATIGQGAGGTR